MARYYFDLEDGRSGRDEEGTALPTLKSMRVAAIEMLGQVLRDKSDTFWDGPDLMLTVRDKKDLVLVRLTVFGTLAPSSR